jgi:hypothetical protein
LIATSAVSLHLRNARDRVLDRILDGQDVLLALADQPADRGVQRGALAAARRPRQQDQAVRLLDGPGETLQVRLAHAEALHGERFGLQRQQAERHALAVLGGERGHANVDRLAGRGEPMGEPAVLRSAFFRNIHA